MSFLKASAVERQGSFGNEGRAAKPKLSPPSRAGAEPSRASRSGERISLLPRDTAILLPTVQFCYFWAQPSLFFSTGEARPTLCEYEPFGPVPQRQRSVVGCCG